MECLKSDCPSKWWKHLKAICKFNNTQNKSFEQVTFNNAPVDNRDLPDVINNFLINITSGIPAIDTTKLDEMRPSCGPLLDKFIIEELDVILALNRIKLNKAIGPDCIPNKVLKNLSDLLASPICAIIN